MKMKRMRMRMRMRKRKRMRMRMRMRMRKRRRRRISLSNCQNLGQRNYEASSKYRSKELMHQGSWSCFGSWLSTVCPKSFLKPSASCILAQPQFRCVRVLFLYL